MGILTRILLKYRALFAAVCLLLVALTAYFAPYFIDNLTGATFAVDGSQTQRTAQLVRERLPNLPSEQDIVVFHSSSRTVQDRTFQQLVAQTRQNLLDKPHVIGVISPFDPDSQQQISADQHTAFMVLNLQGSDNELQKNTTTLQKALPASTNGVELYLTGSSPLNAAVIDQENQDIEHADTIGLPVAFIVLLVAFGAVVAAFLPLALGALGVVTTFGVLGLLSHTMHFDVFVESAVTMIGLALGIDYCLMVVTRFREELAQGKSPTAAVYATMTTAGRAILFSGFTVLVSLSGLLLVQSPLFRGIAIGGMVTVGVMLALCLTLLPIILSLLGHRINTLRLLGRTRKSDREQRFWVNWAHGVMRHPIAVVVGTIVILGAIAWPIFNLRLGLNLGTSTLKDQSSAQGLRLIEQHFAPGVISPIQIVLFKESGVFTKEDLASTATAYTQLSRDGRVKALGIIPQSLAIGENTATTAIISVVPQALPDSQQTMQLFQDIKDRIIPTLVQHNSLRAGYLGATAQIADLNTEVGRAVPIVLMFVLGLSFILLAFTFRSILLPFKAVIMNLLALGAAFGVIVLIFQQGLGEHLFDFRSPGYIQNYLPLLTFVILFGLSMDYEVFLLSRMQEEWQKSSNNTAAVATGLAHTAKVITHAAAIMIVVFLSFLITHMLEIKQLGFALALAVFIDATLIRMLLVPATMQLLGAWNWWAPRWLRRQK